MDFNPNLIGLDPDLTFDLDINNIDLFLNSENILEFPILESPSEELPILESIAEGFPSLESHSKPWDILFPFGFNINPSDLFPFEINNPIFETPATQIIVSN